MILKLLYSRAWLYLVIYGDLVGLLLLRACVATTTMRSMAFLSNNPPTEYTNGVTPYVSCAFAHFNGRLFGSLMMITRYSLLLISLLRKCGPSCWAACLECPRSASRCWSRSSNTVRRWVVRFVYDGPSHPCRLVYSFVADIKLRISDLQKSRASGIC